MSIKIKKGGVIVFDNNSDIEYDIPLKNLADIINSDGYNISDWINQLAPQTWTDKKTMIDLAALIQKEFPNNIIDWDETNNLISKYKGLV